MKKIIWHPTVNDGCMAFVGSLRLECIEICHNTWRAGVWMSGLDGIRYGKTMRKSLDKTKDDAVQLGRELLQDIQEGVVEAVDLIGCGVDN